MSNKTLTTVFLRLAQSFAQEEPTLPRQRLAKKPPPHQAVRICEWLASPPALVSTFNKGALGLRALFNHRDRHAPLRSKHSRPPAEPGGARFPDARGSARVHSYLQSC